MRHRGQADGDAVVGVHDVIIVGGRTVEIVGADADFAADAVGQDGLARDDVDRAADIAAPCERRCRTLGHLDPLGIEGVTEIIAGVADAIDEDVVARGKTADVERVAAAGGIGAQLFLWGSLLSCGLSFMTIISPLPSSIGGLVLGDGEGLYWFGRALHFCAASIQGVGLMLLARRIRALQVPGRSGEGAVSPRG